MTSKKQETKPMPILPILPETIAISEHRHNMNKLWKMKKNENFAKKLKICQKIENLSKIETLSKNNKLVKK